MDHQWMPFLEAVNSGKVFGDRNADRWVTALQELPKYTTMTDETPVFSLVPSGQFANTGGIGTYAKVLLFDHGLAVLILFDEEPSTGGTEQAMFWAKGQITSLIGNTKLLQGEIFVDGASADGVPTSAWVGMIGPKKTAPAFVQVAKRHLGI